MCKSCRTCFKFYCMFYFTCDRSLTDCDRDVRSSSTHIRREREKALGLYRISLFQARSGRSGGTGDGFGENLGLWNDTSDETSNVNNAVSCYEEAVQFSASFVTSLFASV